jgi:hypothetical protein
MTTLELYTDDVGVMVFLHNSPDDESMQISFGKFEQEDRHNMFKHLGLVSEMMKADVMVMCFMGWLIDLDQWHKDRKEFGYRWIEEHPDRKEVAQVSLYTKDKQLQFTAPVLRNKKGKAKVGDWNHSILDLSPEKRSQSNFANIINY